MRYLPFLFLLQFLLLLGWLWFVSKADYFRNVFIGSAILSILAVAAYFGSERYSPGSTAAILNNPVSIRLFTNIDFAYLNKKLLSINLIALAAGLLWIYCYRKVYPVIQEKLYAYKRRIHEKKKEGDIPAVTNLMKWIEPGRFFFGLSAAQPVYLERKTLTHHVQVVGPSGTGKTASILFPLAMQAIQQDIPLIFVDGKGDFGLIRDFIAADPEMLVFNPLSPSQSHSYNPLAGSQDPIEIMNLVAAGLNLDAPGEAQFYTDIQKKYLSSLLALFASTGRRFNFIDILEFTNYESSRKPVYALSNSNFLKEDMNNFLGRLSKNEKELLGLANLIDQLFTADEGVSKIVNAYAPDIDIKSIMASNRRAVFSFSTGKKAQTNEALAKMVLADIANAVGERHASGRTDFMLLILDEFGQYASESFDKFISTCRSAGVGVVLSHQTNAQLHSREGSDRLARIVRENTTTKVILRQSEEADFWAESFGTRKTFKHTEQTEGGAFGTQKISAMGSIREADEFSVHPNTFRQLPVGRAVFKSANDLPVVINCGMWPTSKSEDIVIHRQESVPAEGLNLRCLRMGESCEK